MNRSILTAGPKSVFVNKVVRFDHAASLILGASSARSGLRQTALTGCQLSVCRDQRAELAARARDGDLLEHIQFNQIQESQKLQSVIPCQ